MLKDEQDCSHNGGGYARPLKNGETFHPQSIQKSERMQNVLYKKNCKKQDSFCHVFKYKKQDNPR